MERRNMRQKGLLLLDAVAGLALIGVLLGLLTVAVNQHRHAAETMHTQRRLDRLAEGVVTDLQRGVSPDVPKWDTEVEPAYSVRVLEDKGPRDGWVWVEVTATHDRHQATLVAAVPEASATDFRGTP